MKVILTEEQYNKVMLTELGNRGKGLLSYIRKNYAVMGEIVLLHVLDWEINGILKQDISNELKI